MLEHVQSPGQGTVQVDPRLLRPSPSITHQQPAPAGKAHAASNVQPA